MSFWKLAAGAAMTMAVVQGADATVVTSIRISSALPDYLQISEVIANQASSGTDVALASQGATASSFSSYNPGSEAFAIDGVGPSAYPSIYHSAGASASEYLLVTLAQAYDITNLTVQGRTDCCASRDFYAYQLFNGATVVGSGTLDARSNDHSASVALPATLVSDVPESASWVMMVAGFGLLGTFLRRRQSLTVQFS